MDKVLIMRVVIAATLISLAALIYLVTRSNYHDCILEHISKAHTDVAALAIATICREKHPN